MSNQRACSTSARASPAARKARAWPVHHARRQPAAWPHVRPIFQAIAAKVADGRATALLRLGRRGRRRPLRQDGAQRHRVRRHAAHLRSLPTHEGRPGPDDRTRCTKSSPEWNKGELDSYLIEITRDILAYKDEDGSPLVDKILDKAGQKGTGKWTGISALGAGHAADHDRAKRCCARCLSALKDERVAAARALCGPRPKFERRPESRSSTTWKPAAVCVQDPVATRRASC